MKHTRPWLMSFVAFFLVLVAFSCKREEPITLSQFAWSSQEPMSIPLSERKRVFDAGNLVINPSFETGRSFRIDTGKVSYNIDGWKVVGDNVVWVDIERDTCIWNNEVFEGARAIRISREKPLSLNSRDEGVLSDYIRVIPGNYTFSVHLRMKDILPLKSYLGIKLDESINIRLKYYDKNKVLVGSDVYSEYLDQYLDNSFKGYGFSGLKRVDELHWAKIYGKTFTFPFSEGDIPDNARFVRIFIGLKGMGDLWIDNVDFRLSRWNFSILERLGTYTDSVYSYPGLLIPTPRSIVENGTVELLDEDYQYQVSIVKPLEQSLQVAGAIDLFTRKIEGFQSRGNETSNLPVFYYSNPTPTPVIFSFGETSLFSQFKHRLPVDEIEGKTNAYFIHSLAEDSLLMIFVKGFDKTGEYYGINTVTKLINDSLPLFHNANIIDYPDRDYRSFQVNSITDTLLPDLNELASWRLNGVFVASSSREDYNQRMPDLSAFTNKGLVISLDKCFVTTDSASNQLVLDRQYLSDLFLSSDFYERIRLIAGDLLVSHKQFKGSSKGELYQSYEKNLQAVNQVVGYTREVYQANNKDVEISILPIYFSNELINLHPDKSIKYFTGLPANVQVLWTGSSLKSLQLDHSDLLMYQYYSGVGRPMLYDNSLDARESFGHYGGYAAYYPGKVRMCCLFQPYDVRCSRELINSLEFQPNLLLENEFDLIRLITFSAYAWNHQDYDPEQVLWKLLVSRYGKQSALNLLKYNDLYFSLWDMCMKLERGQNIYRHKKYAGDYLDKLELVLLDLKADDVHLSTGFYALLELKKEELKNNYYSILRELKILE